jgi:hypothetical protein
MGNQVRFSALAVSLLFGAAAISTTAVSGAAEDF